jgi:hypothetical protein
MMNSGQLFDIIESHEMAARVNVASGLKTALAIARQEAAVRELAEKIGAEDLAEPVLMRVVGLVHRAADVRYENPNDSALMIYTLLLSEWSESFGYAAAGLLAHLPNLWWASQLAREILTRAPEPPVAEGAKSHGALGEITALESGDALFVPDAKAFLGRGVIAAESVLNIEADAGSVNFKSQ